MFVYVGTIVQSTIDNPCEIRQNAAIGVADGKIIFVEDASRLSHLQTQYDIDGSEIYRLADREFLMPGLVDTHTHAPQYVNAGTGLDLPLLEWLLRYTFPTEADENSLSDTYRKIVKRTLHNGTTTACYFATIHLRASLTLCDVIAELGQRGFVGKVCMDRHSPEYYTEDTHQSIRDTETFVKSVLAKKNPLLAPVVTPRFALCASEELMRGLAVIAQKYKLRIQSHLAESRAECDRVAELFPASANYSDVYRQVGLFDNQTIMAHGIYLSDAEVTLIQQSGVSIAHCPNSNISLHSGLCDVRRLLDKGVKVGLGTDLSAGYQPSVLDAIRCAIQTSNVIGLDRGATYRTVDYREAFRMATLGGCEALGIASLTGNFDVGKQFDALRINPCAANSPIDVFDKDDVTDVVQKFLYLGDDRNIARVYVNGRDVTIA